MSEFKFEPWNMHSTKVLKRLSLEILDPPCRHCTKWRPRIKTDSFGNFDGVVLCTASDQHHDFSCFTSKPDANDRKA